MKVLFPRARNTSDANANRIAGVGQQFRQKRLRCFGVLRRSAFDQGDGARQRSAVSLQYTGDEGLVNLSVFAALASSRSSTVDCFR